MLDWALKIHSLSRLSFLQWRLIHSTDRQPSWSKLFSNQREIWLQWDFNVLPTAPGDLGMSLKTNGPCFSKCAVRLSQGWTCQYIWMLLKLVHAKQSNQCHRQELAMNNHLLTKHQILWLSTMSPATDPPQKFTPSFHISKGSQASTDQTTHWSRKRPTGKQSPPRTPAFTDKTPNPAAFQTGHQRTLPQERKTSFHISNGTQASTVDLVRQPIGPGKDNGETISATEEKRVSINRNEQQITHRTPILVAFH